MTTQTILVLAGIVSAFAVFGITLAWADYYSQGARKPEINGVSAGEERRSHTHLDEERRAA
jgi:hypothetical protein